jgi:hypothetical protein
MGGWISFVQSSLSGDASLTPLASWRVGAASGVGALIGQRARTGRIFGLCRWRRRCGRGCRHHHRWGRWGCLWRRGCGGLRRCGRRSIGHGRWRSRRRQNITAGRRGGRCARYGRWRHRINWLVLCQGQRRQNNQQRTKQNPAFGEVDPHTQLHQVTHRYLGCGVIPLMN